ncbi:uncharacterized protein FTOL_13560 [Fusarium torulosum]|uniref:Uncharacterized protein n=1 Tax=Fusarium torulosum TaxID=33205 RepID=A0AAE8SQC9_9HYPO|nr:uncharacterized protein FTOL_13560 [Fusarium torulosum]
MIKTKTKTKQTAAWRQLSAAQRNAADNNIRPEMMIFIGCSIMITPNNGSSNLFAPRAGLRIEAQPGPRLEGNQSPPTKQHESAILQEPPNPNPCRLRESF